jgi:glycosyltransferase involved in cell wall biosynthesis
MSNASSELTRTPLVSVLVCTYNAGPFLRPAVLSLLGQVYTKLEIVVVDDGSDDGCIETIADLTDARIKLVRQENLGKAGALNRGVAESTGELFAIQDADDLSHPRRIEQQVGLMLEHPDLAAVLCGHELILNGKHLAPRARACDRAECRRIVARMGMPAHDPTAMYRRALVQGFRFEGFEPAEGLDFILRVGEKLPMMVVGECLYSYRISAGSATRQDSERRFENVLSVFARACARRGLPEGMKTRFFNAPWLLGRNRVRDHNLPAHFMESCIDLCRSGQRVQAARTALVCSAMRPFDLHYHKALLYSVLPQALVTRLRRTVKRHEAMANGFSLED